MIPPLGIQVQEICVTNLLQALCKVIPPGSAESGTVWCYRQVTAPGSAESGTVWCYRQVTPPGSAVSGAVRCYRQVTPPGSAVSGAVRCYRQVTPPGSAISRTVSVGFLETFSILKQLTVEMGTKGGIAVYG